MITYYIISYYILSYYIIISVYLYYYMLYIYHIYPSNDHFQGTVIILLVGFFGSPQRQLDDLDVQVEALEWNLHRS